MKLLLRSDVGLANSKASIEKVLELIDYPDPAYAVSGAKCDCPFMTVFHPDSGRSFRVYDNEGAFCFACNERFTPVQLYARHLDVSPDEAAEQLLDAIGYRAPSAEERFQAAIQDSFELDERSLEEALKLYCARINPLWEIRQFDDDVAHKFRQCVELLPAVRSPEDIKVWLNASKTAMRRVLGEAA